MDCVVKSWIFLGNREARSIQLETRFRNFVQGDLSVTEYCRKLKKMADDLTALGEVITDRTLVLNVIRGLNERFAHVGTLLRRAKPFPTFLEAREDLILEELTMANRKEAPAAALTASTTPTAAPPPSAGSGGAGGGSKAPNSRRSKRGGGGKGQGSSSASGQGSRSPAGAIQQQQAAGQQQQPAGGGGGAPLAQLLQSLVRHHPDVARSSSSAFGTHPGAPSPPSAAPGTAAGPARSAAAAGAFCSPAARWTVGRSGVLQPYDRPPFLGPDGSRRRLQHDIADPSFDQRVVLRLRFFHLGKRSSGVIAPGHCTHFAFHQHFPLPLRAPLHCGIGVLGILVTRPCQSSRLVFHSLFRIVPIYVMLVS
ncbi:uncharacterized protein [Miscanthus floridulus]|uniref:uncharacterized protein n=1 Tax=Miscanthus floridulus TaxID=154761 RepID=UPI00345998FA